MEPEVAAVPEPRTGSVVSDPPDPPPSPDGGSEAGPVAELRRLVVEAVSDGMIVVDAGGTIVLDNQRARAMFGDGRSDTSLVGVPVDDLLPESLRALHARHRGTYARHPRAREMGSGLELLGRRLDGTEVPVEVSLTPVTVDGALYAVAEVRDLTERRAAKASLTAAQDRLALVAERERISRDLHDSVVQRLYGAGLGMQAALGGDGDRLRRVVATAVEEIDATIAEIRSVIHDLRRDPSQPDRLVDRLGQVVDSQAAALGVEVRLHVVGHLDAEPPEAMADAVVAVVREGIANAHRHGGASRIDIALEVDVDGRIRVEVTDDGSGFDPATESDSGGYGLKNLRARALEFGGTFTVRSEPGSGTHSVWEVPAARR